MSEQIYVIGYARVSTPKQAQSGESLDDQEKEIRRYVALKGYTLFPAGKVFRESYTGTKRARPEYDEILKLVKANKGKITYFVFWDFDRLVRSGESDYEGFWKDLAPYNIDLRDCYDVIQAEVNYFADVGDYGYDFAKGRPSEEAEYAKVQSAKQERKKILRRLIKPQIRLTQDGYHIGRPDDGYVNKLVFVENKKKCIQVPDPERARYIIKMFELRAEGVHSDPEIVNILNSENYRTPVTNRWNKDKSAVIGHSGGIPLSVKQLQRNIKRVTYAGVICEKWTGYEPIRAKYKGLVTIEIFNRANKGKVFIQENKDGTVDLKYNLSKLSLKRKKFNPNFPIRGVLLCDYCHQPMTASPSKGKSGKRYSSYHCTRGHKRFAIPKGEAEGRFSQMIDRLAFTDMAVKVLERGLIHTFRIKEGECAEVTAGLSNEIADLELQKAAHIRAFSAATLDVVRRGLEDQIQEVQLQIDKVKDRRKKAELREEEITEFVAWGRSLMEHPAKMLEDIDSLEEQHAVYGLIFEVYPTYTEIVNGTPKLTPFFKLDKEKVIDENQLVTPPGIEPGFTP